MHESCLTEMRRRGSSGRCPVCRIKHDELTTSQDFIDRGNLHHRRGDMAECVRVFSALVDMDPENSHGNFALGELYENGKGVAKDPSRACEFYEVAIQKGHVEAMNNLGIIHWNRGDLQRARELLEKARQGGNSEAANNLGLMCKDEGDMKTAQKYWEESFKQGNPSVGVNLGTPHRMRGDVKAAKSYYEEAMRRGDASGASCLGNLYHESQEPIDLAKAIKYYRCAERRGDRSAAYNLAHVYQKLGDFVRACECLGRAQAAGHPQAESMLEMLKIGERHATDTFRLGDRVQLGEVDGTVGLQFNGCIGIIADIPLAGPYGVKVRGVTDLIQVEFWHLIKLNSTSQPSWDSSDSSEEMEDRDVEETGKQTAIELDATNPHTAAASQRCDSGLNAQVSDTVLRYRPADVGVKVLLLKLSRRPSALQDVLLQSHELSDCRNALEECGYSVKLSSGAYVFVRPEHYAATLEAIRIQGKKLYPNNILVDVELEMMVTEVVRGLPGREKVYTRSREVTPLAFASAVTSFDFKVSIRRTFIEIHVPSSLRSEKASGPRTASTTDAGEQRKGTNPRKETSSRKSVKQER